MSSDSALKTLLWSSSVFTDQEDLILDAQDFEPSPALKNRISKEWETFKQETIQQGFNPVAHRLAEINLEEGGYWDHVAHDWVLTRQSHGSGFWDAGKWAKPWDTKLTQLSRTFQEITLFLSPEGLLEADS